MVCKIENKQNTDINFAKSEAAVLNFGLYPQGFFPQLAITAIVVPGKEIGETSQRGERFLNNKRIEGTLPEMLTEAIAFCNLCLKAENF